MVRSRATTVRGYHVLASGILFAGSASLLWYLVLSTAFLCLALLPDISAGQSWQQPARRFSVPRRSAPPLYQPDSILTGEVHQAAFAEPVVSDIPRHVERNDAVVHVNDFARPARAGGFIQYISGKFRLVQVEQPQQPFTPEPGAASVDQLSLNSSTEQPFQPFSTGFEFGGPQLLPEDRQPLVNAAPASEIVTANQANIQTSPYLGQALSETTETVKVQRRSSAFFDPQIRGFRGGQIYSLSDGVFNAAARQDLDTMLSTIDPSTIQDVIVIPGPYGVRYGPAFGFIDIARTPTPRYDGGFESHVRISENYQDNGSQNTGRTMVYGGDKNWGYRVSYGDRRGSDYRSGDSTLVPGSYNSRDLSGEISFDTVEGQRIEFSYSRLDQGNTEFAAQFFDIDALTNQGYNLRLIDEDPTAPWTRLVAQGWYNETKYAGDTLNQSKRDSGVIPRVEVALSQALNEPTPIFQGFTQGDLLSTGARLGVTHGDPDWVNLTWGPDFRYLSQQTAESFFINNLILPEDPIFTNMPKSYMLDPGFFAELSFPLFRRWTTTFGARVDYVQTSADIDRLRTIGGTYAGSLPGVREDRGVVDQDDVLYAFFANNRLKLNDAWTANVGFGHAQRPPTLLDRYADGVFLAVIQNGFSRVIGDPNLDKARNWQIDAGLDVETDGFRAQIRGYHAWVLDYITYRVNPILDPTGARLLLATNTDLARLTGADASTEFDLGSYLTAFGSVSYVVGVDEQINQPLPSIPPLDGRLGLRIHDPHGGSQWGFEYAVRIVDGQNRIGSLRLGLSDTLVSPVEQATPGFTISSIRGYYNVSERLNLIAGVENLFDRNYIEHLNIRLPSAGVFPQVAALNPGIFPYLGMQWTY